MMRDSRCLLQVTAWMRVDFETADRKALEVL